MEIRTPHREMGKCSHCGGTVLECYCLEPQFEKQKTHPTLDRLKESLGPNTTPPYLKVTEVNIPVSNILLVSTSGDDYCVLEKVDSNIKTHAVNGNLDSVDQIKDSSEETLSEALGKSESTLTPENKHWILREMGFTGLGKGRWKHVLFDEEIEFDLQTDMLIQLAYKIHKTGYRNAQSQFDKTGTV